MHGTITHPGLHDLSTWSCVVAAMHLRNNIVPPTPSVYFLAVVMIVFSCAGCTRFAYSHHQLRKHALSKSCGIQQHTWFREGQVGVYSVGEGLQAKIGSTAWQILPGCHITHWDGTHAYYTHLKGTSVLHGFAIHKGFTSQHVQQGWVLLGHGEVTGRDSIKTWQ